MKCWGEGCVLVEVVGDKDGRRGQGRCPTTLEVSCMMTKSTEINLTEPYDEIQPGCHQMVEGQDYSRLDTSRS